MKVYARLIEKLRAEEELIRIRGLQIGSGLMEKAQQEAAFAKLTRAASVGSARKPARKFDKEEFHAQLQGLGIAVVIEKDEGQKDE